MKMARAINPRQNTRLQRACAAACLGLWLAAGPALAASITHVFAGGAAEITLDDTIWQLVSKNKNETVFSCERDDCPDVTVLRLSAQKLDAGQRGMPRGELLAQWAARPIRREGGGDTITPLGPPRRIVFDRIEGVVHRLRIAGPQDSNEGRLFQTPHRNQKISVDLIAPEPVEGDILTLLQDETIPYLKLR